MATNATVPPLPSKDTLVPTRALLQAVWANYRNAQAFSGVSDPTAIWSMMTRNDSTAMILYRELEDKDDDISGSLEELKLSVAEREWTILPGDDSAAAVDSAEFMKQQFAGIDFDAFLDSLLDAPAYGFWVGEMMFDASTGQASLKSIADCPQELFLFGNRFQPQIGNLQLLDSPYAMDGTELPEEKFVIFTYRGRAQNRMGRPMLKQAFWLSWIKRQALSMWLKCAGKNGGTAVVRYPDESLQAQKDFALQCAQALASAAALGIPESFSYDIELLKSGNVEKGDVYEKLVQKCEYSIARLIKGETLTSFGNENGKGSRAQGETHSETFDKRSVSLARKAGRIINQQMVQRLHLWNYGPKVAAPLFSFDVDLPEDLTRKSTILRNLQAMGVPLGQKYVMTEFDIPAIAEDDVALVPNAAVTVPATPSAAFSESQEDVASSYGALDLLTEQLKRDAIQVFDDRVREITGALVPALKRKV